MWFSWFFVLPEKLVLRFNNKMHSYINIKCRHIVQEISLGKVGLKRINVKNEMKMAWNGIFCVFIAKRWMVIFKCAYMYLAMWSERRALELADTPNAYSSIKNKNRLRGLWGPLRGHDVFSERLLLNYR